MQVERVVLFTGCQLRVFLTNKKKEKRKIIKQSVVTLHLHLGCKRE